MKWNKIYAVILNPKARLNALDGKAETSPTFAILALLAGATSAFESETAVRHQVDQIAIGAAADRSRATSIQKEAAVPKTIQLAPFAQITDLDPATYNLHGTQVDTERTRDRNHPTDDDEPNENILCLISNDDLTITTDSAVADALAAIAAMPLTPPVLALRSVPAAEALTSPARQHAAGVPHDYSTLHQTFAHMSEDVVRATAKHYELAIDDDGTGSRCVCVACAIANLRREPHFKHSRNPRLHKPGEDWEFDLAGPFPKAEAESNTLSTDSP